MPITLHINGMGHVPSFKNQKQIAGLRGDGKNRWKGKPVLLTKFERKRWMDAAILSFVSQLRSAIPTTTLATPTEPSPPSSTASSERLSEYVPLDDSRQWIPQISVICQDCAKGDEGATITIERIGD